ncbi:hypothetical protein ACLB2K_054643 [Fragaria x ananassa]
MPSKLKKAIGAVKDQTSISLAKVSNASTSANLEVTILKATSHDVVPIDDKYVHEILTLISSSKSNAAACAQAIAKRIGKTRNWIVALKSLMLVLRIFQDGDPFFPIEVLHAMKRGAKILNLSNFKDESTSCPWDYTSFVRNFALYLDERLDCFLTGKLQRRVGRTSEYPSVQKISEELIETLQEFVKDQASFPGRSPPCHLNQNRTDKGTVTSLEQQFEFADSEPHESTASDFGSACTSLSDLASVGGIENGASPSRSVEQDFLTSDEQLSEKTLSPLQSPLPEFMVGSNETNDKAPSQTSSQVDLLDLFQPQQTDHVQQANQEGEKPQWELVLFESANQNGATETSPITSPPPNLFASLSPNMSPNLLEASSSPDLDYFFQNSSTSNALHINNPFLQDILQVEGFAIPTSNETTSNVGLENLDDFSFPSTSQPTVPPTFSSQNPNGAVAPICSEVDTIDRTVVPTFRATNPKETEIAPTFSAHSVEAGSSMPASFCAQSTNNSITAPTFQAEVPSDRTFAVSFGEEKMKETEVAPTFSAQSGEGTSMSPYFCALSNNSLTAPTFIAEFAKDRTLALSICTVNSEESTVSHKFGELAPNNELMAVPTFSTSTSDNETPRMFGSPFAIQNDDPFGPFSSMTSTTEPLCNGTMTQEAVLLQQRQWLEQQNKIIVKHLT